MRCKACDVELNDYEATRKSAMSLEYIDLCENCFSYIADDIPVIDRPDLLNFTVIEEDDDEI